MQYSFSGSESNEGNYTSVRVAAVFPGTFPEVESAIKMTEYACVVKCDDKLFDEKKFMYADSNFFNIFSFHLLQGDPQTALAMPYNIVLTQNKPVK